MLLLPEYEQDLSDAMILWLLSRPRVALVGKMCQNPRKLEHLRGDTVIGSRTVGEPRTCARPVWGDGRVDGEFYGLCSRCWHEYNAFHGHYVTTAANPAAAKLGMVGIQRLTFGATLPDVGAHGPDVFPSSWLT